MSSVYTSISAASPSTNRNEDELLDDQLNDWWLATVLGDAEFISDDSQSSLGWEFEMEEPAVDSCNKPSTEEQQQVFSFVDVSSRNEKTGKLLAANKQSKMD